MRAVVYSAYGAIPELTRVADPACPADGVVIEGPLGQALAAKGQTSGAAHIGGMSSRGGREAVPK